MVYCKFPFPINVIGILQLNGMLLNKISKGFVVCERKNVSEDSPFTVVDTQTKVFLGAFNGFLAFEKLLSASYES